jgi:hypothetical protein
MVAGAVGAAIGSYLFQLVVGRVLGPTVFAPVSALWTLQFLIFTIVILPLEQMLVSRIVAGKTGSLVRLTGITASVTCVIVVLIGYVWRDDLFGGSVWFGVQLGLIVLVYAWFALRRARLAASGRYRRYGFVTLLESAIRFMVAAAILVAGGGAIAIGWALVSGGLAALFTGRTSGPVHPVSQESGGASLLWALVGANGTGQLLLAGGPLAAAARGLAPGQISIVFMVMVLYRAPITLAYGVVARVIRPVVKLQIDSGRQGLRSLATRSLMIAAPVAILAWFVGWSVGPQLVQLLLGEAFAPTRLFSASIAAGMVFATLGLLMQQILIVIEYSVGLIGPWFFGLAAAVTVLALVADPLVAIGGGFLVGEVVALVGLAVAIRTRR